MFQLWEKWEKLVFQQRGDEKNWCFNNKKIKRDVVVKKNRKMLLRGDVGE